MRVHKTLPYPEHIVAFAYANATKGAFKATSVQDDDDADNDAADDAAADDRVELISRTDDDVDDDGSVWRQNKTITITFVAGRSRAPSALPPV